MSSTLAFVLCGHTAFMTQDSCESHSAAQLSSPGDHYLCFLSGCGGEEILFSSCLNIPPIISAGGFWFKMEKLLIHGLSLFPKTRLRKYKKE